MKHNFYASLLLPSLLLLSIVACRKPTVDTQVYASEPIMVRTSLADTLAAKTFASLNIANVEGIQFRYPDGRTVSYFEYHADPETLLKAISRSGFQKYSLVADTTCRAMDDEPLKAKLSQTELQYASFYWQLSRADYQPFECLKSPVKHSIRISVDGKTVFHRIEKEA